MQLKSCFIWFKGEYSENAPNTAFKQLGRDVAAMSQKPLFTFGPAGHHGLSDGINNELFVINLAAAGADVTRLPQLLKCFNVTGNAIILFEVKPIFEIHFMQGL